MSDYFGEMLQVAKNEFGSKVSDGVEAGDVESFIDTGERRICRSLLTVLSLF